MFGHNNKPSSKQRKEETKAKELRDLLEGSSSFRAKTQDQDKVARPVIVENVKKEKKKKAKATVKRERHEGDAVVAQPGQENDLVAPAMIYAPALKKQAFADHVEHVDTTPVTTHAAEAFEDVLAGLKALQAELVLKMESEVNMSEAKMEAVSVATLEAETLATLEAETLATLEAETLATLEAERLAALEAERLAALEAERLAALEAERLAALESQKKAAEEVEKYMMRSSFNLFSQCKANELHAAAAKGDNDEVLALLEKKVAVDALDSNGHTPLWLAVNGGHIEVVKTLLYKGNADKHMFGTQPGLGIKSPVALLCIGESFDKGGRFVAYTGTPNRHAIMGIMFDHDNHVYQVYQTEMAKRQSGTAQEEATFIPPAAISNKGF